MFHAIYACDASWTPSFSVINSVKERIKRRGSYSPLQQTPFPFGRPYGRFSPAVGFPSMSCSVEDKHARLQSYNNYFLSARKTGKSSLTSEPYAWFLWECVSMSVTSWQKSQMESKLTWLGEYAQLGVDKRDCRPRILRMTRIFLFDFWQFLEAKPF